MGECGGFARPSCHGRNLLKDLAFKRVEKKAVWFSTRLFYYGILILFKFEDGFNGSETNQVSIFEEFSFCSFVVDVETV